MKLRLLMAACVLASFAATTLAQEPATPLAEDPVYQQNCAKCHGKAGEGRMFAGPSLIKSKKTVDDIGRIINSGKGKMPRFAGKLTDAKIKALTTEITAVQK